MSIVLTGGVGITTPNLSATNDVQASSLNGGQLAGFRNKIINGAFQVNQRGVSGTVTLAAGAYGHDRWKAGSGGCTYTFSTVDNVTTITVSAGTLVQIIEGLNLQSGLHVLSWQGTAQGRVGSGAYGDSGEVLDTVVGGSNTPIEFSTGTVAFVQFEAGDTSTPFEHRPYGAELAFCQRYYESAAVGVIAASSRYSDNTGVVGCLFRQTKRAVPTVGGLATGSASNISMDGFTWVVALAISSSTSTGFTAAAEL